MSGAGGLYVFAAGQPPESIMAGYGVAKTDRFLALRHADAPCVEILDFSRSVRYLVSEYEIADADLDDFHSVMDALGPRLAEASSSGEEVWINVTTSHVPASLALYASAGFYSARALWVEMTGAGAVAREVPALPQAPLPEEAYSILEALLSRGGSALMAEVAEDVRFNRKSRRGGRRSPEEKIRVSNVGYYVRNHLVPRGLVSISVEGKRYRLALTERGRHVARRAADYRASAARPAPGASAIEVAAQAAGRVGVEVR